MCVNGMAVPTVVIEMGKEMYLTSKTFEMVNYVKEHYNLRHYNDAIEKMYSAWVYMSEHEL
jgi:hypothetical protein